MSVHRKMKRVEGLSTEQEHVFECSARPYVLRVLPQASIEEIRLEFDSHDCDKNPAAISAN
jgi:hypothetical protein